MKIDGKWKKIVVIGCFVCCFFLREISFATYACALASDEAVDGGGGTALAIDSRNIYEGMATSYAKGYVPKISGGKAIVVLPLLSKRELKNKQMTASLQLTESQTQPFVCKNYEKSVSFGYYKTAKRGKKPAVISLLSD